MIRDETDLRKNCSGREMSDMGMFLNNLNCFEDYREMVSDTYFVDKSALLRHLGTISCAIWQNFVSCFSGLSRLGN